MDKNDNVLGKRLKELRRKVGKSQEEIARMIGISRARYSHYENNYVEPDIQLIKKLAAIYNVSTDYLLGFDAKQLEGEQLDDEFISFVQDLERWYHSPPKNKKEDLRRLRRIFEAYKDDI